MIKRFIDFFSRGDSKKENRLDFSSIDSHEKLIEAAENEELFPILIFPKIFGGENIDVNRVYVPPDIPRVQNQIIATIARFLEEGLIDNMTVTPEYKNSSLVPSRLVIETFNKGNSGQFNPTIDIW